MGLLSARPSSYEKLSHLGAGKFTAKVLPFEAGSHITDNRLQMLSAEHKDYKHKRQNPQIYVNVTRSTSTHTKSQSAGHQIPHVFPYETAERGEEEIFYRNQAFMSNGDELKMHVSTTRPKVVPVAVSTIVRKILSGISN